MEISRKTNLQGGGILSLLLPVTAAYPIFVRRFVCSIHMTCKQVEAEQNCRFLFVRSLFDAGKPFADSPVIQVIPQILQGDIGIPQQWMCAIQYTANGFGIILSME